MFGKTGENHPRFGKNFSTDTLTKMSVTKGGGTIYVYNIQGTLYNSFSSARKAAIFFDSNHITIMKYVKMVIFLKINGSYLYPLLLKNK